MPNPRSSDGSPRGGDGRTYLGWRHAVLLPHPGPAPRRPAPDEQRTLSEEWIADQRAGEARTNRPLYAVLGGLVLLAVLFLVLWSQRILPAALALGGVFACAAVAAPVGFALVQSRQVIAERLAEAGERLAAERAERDRLLRERQREHARRYTEWRAASRAYEAQPHWYGVTVPADRGSVVVVGGTDAGWSALLTTVGVARLREGGDLTVVDLTGRAVARELVRLARRCAVAPRRWVLPADLPRMTLGTNLDAGQRARVLSAVAAASGTPEEADADETLLLRLLEVLGPRAGIAELIGGLRALCTPEGDEAGDDPALARLSADQRARVRARCADTPGAWERAWELERRLSPFEAVGTRAEDGTYAQVKIISTDRASGEVAARVYGTYAVAALSELLEDGPRGGAEPPRRERRRARPDRTRTVVVCGAETLPEGEVDQILRAAADGGVEVVLMFRTPVPAALARFSDPACLPVVMRQRGGAADTVARAVASVPGVAARPDTGVEVHRLSEVIGEAVGTAVTEPHPDPEAEAEADDRFFPSPHTESGAMIRDSASGISPLDLVRHVRSATAWGRATAQAAEIDEPAGVGAEGGGPSRPLGLDAGSLRRLPCTAALVLGDEGPVLTDTNPGILTLSTATLATVADSRTTGHGAGAVSGADERAAEPGDPDRRRRRTAATDRPRAERETAPSPPDPPRREAVIDGESPERVPPNLGPPPERLDWRV
ncbi:hypothetical protein [Nocardiopsis sp. FIRDI 009]|uniref:hypothetical protein n=1 Tax=Nocardiopsis sp. FIRDI 009 TaxID=714197 RepID=UPI001E4AC37B|nr:hypothetical protein [Nocardiopsis sp. FIRDI 009]